MPRCWGGRSKPTLIGRFWLTAIMCQFEKNIHKHVIPGLSRHLGSLKTKELDSHFRGNDINGNLGKLKLRHNPDSRHVANIDNNDRVVLGFGGGSFEYFMVDIGDVDFKGREFRGPRRRGVRESPPAVWILGLRPSCLKIRLKSGSGSTSESSSDTTGDTFWRNSAAQGAAS
jgi:hypothetical protein